MFYRVEIREGTVWGHGVTGSFNQTASPDEWASLFSDRTEAQKVAQILVECEGFEPSQVRVAEIDDDDLLIYLPFDYEREIETECFLVRVDGRELWFATCEPEVSIGRALMRATGVRETHIFTDNSPECEV